MCVISCILLFRRLAPIDTDMADKDRRPKDPPALHAVFEHLTEKLASIGERLNSIDDRLGRVESELTACALLRDNALALCSTPAKLPDAAAVDVLEEQFKTQCIVADAKIVKDVAETLDALGYERTSSDDDTARPRFLVDGTVFQVEYVPLYDAVCIAPLQASKNPGMMNELFHKLGACVHFKERYSLQRRSSVRGDERAEVTPNAPTMCPPSGQ